MQWESLDKDVKFAPASARLFGLAPGESAPLAVTISVADPTRAAVRIVAAMGADRLAFGAPVSRRRSLQRFPDRQWPLGDRLAPRHGARRFPFGEGNRDGQAAPGETFVILVPDGDALRPAEVFSKDACVDTGLRGSDSWDYYDHQLASLPYSVLRIPENCEPGRVVHVLARIVTPSVGGYHTRYEAIRFPVWWAGATAKSRTPDCWMQIAEYL